MANRSAPFSLLLLAALGAQSPAPCLHTSFGTNLHLGLDQVQTSVPLGFVFPGPAGPVSSISISSNGFVWLGTNTDAACCDGNEQDFLNQMPRIAALWTGLDTVHGAVYQQTLPASGGVPASAVITWDAPEQYGPGIHLLLQLQLFSDGSFTIYHGPTTGVVAHGCLTGVTSGNGATPDRIDFLNLQTAAYDTQTNPSVYDVMPFGFGQPTYTLTGRSWEFMPNARGGYVCRERRTCRSAAFEPFGDGCPQPPTFYEQFAPGTFDLANQSILILPNGHGGWVALPGAGQIWPGFSNNLNLFRDQLAVGLSLPFVWHHPAGNTNLIDVDSNGCVYPQSGVFQSSRISDGNPAVFLREPPSLAVLWQEMQTDLQTGAICFDIDASNQTAYVTWSNVAEAGSSNLFTVQLAIFASGGFELVYGAVTNANHAALVGYSMGNFARDPGSRDLGAVPWVQGANGPPLTLSAVAGSRPVIGSQFALQVDHMAAGSSLGLLLVALRRTTIDLASFGAPDCFAYVDFTVPGASVAVPFASAGPAATLRLNIPNNDSLVGLQLQAQAAALAPALNALGVIASNGGHMLLGR